MVSGDVALHIEVFDELRISALNQITANPQEWLTVKWVANEYSRIYSKIKAERAARDVLAPLGLTSDLFIARQKQMDQDLVKQLAREIIHFQMPEADVIIAGIDADGAHLYVGIDGAFTHERGAGYCAIGAGEQHAESSLMAAAYAKTQAFARCLYLTYAAKRRAEVAQGVGVFTDMFTIGPQPGSFTVIDPNVVDGLRRIYENAEQKLGEVANAAEQEAHGYVQGLIEAAAAAAKAAKQEGQQPVPPDAPRGTPASGPESGGKATEPASLRPPAKRPRRKK